MIKLKLNFLFIAISGICLAIFEGSHGSHRAAPELMCLIVNMTAAVYEEEEEEEKEEEEAEHHLL